MKLDLTYEILAWADGGGTEGDRPSTLNDVDDAMLQTKIGKMIDRGLIGARIVQGFTQDCRYNRYLDLHLKDAGRKRHLRLWERHRGTRSSQDK